jgi:hypothetical protein
MLGVISEIGDCYRRAAEARDRAKQAHDPAFRQAFSEVERCWLNLARSYEMTERLLIIRRSDALEASGPWRLRARWVQEGLEHLQLTILQVAGRRKWRD